MKFLNVEIPVKNLPELDPGFVPLGLFFQHYATGAEKPLCIAVERSGGQIGTWECKELIGQEMLELFAMEEDLDTSKIPSNNDDFTISITDEGDHAKFTPSSTGNLADLFRTCDMTYTAPFNVLEGKVSGSCTTVGEQYFWVDEGSFDLTYFQLSSGNRSFDNSKETLGKLTIALMLDKDGSMILFLRDFDQPPFLPEWWEDPFDPTFFGLGYRFEKVAQ